MKKRPLVNKVKKKGLLGIGTSSNANVIKIRNVGQPDVYVPVMDSNNAANLTINGYLTPSGGIKGNVAITGNVTTPSLIVSNVTTNKTVTVTSSASQAANYGLVLPPIVPSVAAALVSDTSGNLSYSNNTAMTANLLNPTFSGTLSGVIQSGVTTSMTATAVGHTFSSSSVNAMWIIIGNICYVQGTITATIIGGAYSQAILTLPVARSGNFTTTSQAVGMSPWSSNYSANTSNSTSIINTQTVLLNGFPYYVDTPINYPFNFTYTLS